MTGLPTGAQVIHVSQGSYDGTTGEWNIGELRVRDYYRSAGMPEPTLVLGASAGDTADVSIANSESYEVCVGPKDTPGDLAHITQAACEAVTNASWNSTPVYDYKTDNNTATITAQAGTGGVGPSTPTLLSADDLSPSITVTWDAVDFVNGVPVTHYEVQRQTNPWVTLANDVEGTEYVDTDVNPGDTFQYRVRAVNGAGVEGPWSHAHRRASVPVPETASAGAPDAPVLTCESSRRGHRPHPDRPRLGQTPRKRRIPSPPTLWRWPTAGTAPGPSPLPRPSLARAIHVMESHRPHRRRPQVLPHEGDQRARATAPGPPSWRPPRGRPARPARPSPSAPLPTATPPSTCRGWRLWTTAARRSNTTRCSGPPTARPAGATRGAPRTRRPSPSRTPA